MGTGWVGDGSGPLSSVTICERDPSMCHFAFRAADFMSSMKSKASPSSCGNAKYTLCPTDISRDLAISDIWELLSLRGKRASSVAVVSFARPKAYDARSTALSDCSFATFAAASAVLADFAASPAFWSASVNFAKSYSWTALCASSSLAPHLHSATTPTTTTISPIRVKRLTHLGWSEFDSVLSLTSPAGKTSASSFRTANSFFLSRRRLIHAIASWRSSTPSIATPTATVMFAIPTNLEKWRTDASSAFLVGSSIGESKNMSDWLDRRLQLVAIGAVVLYLFCIWEFTIGIKKSIKKLFRSII